MHRECWTVIIAFQTRNSYQKITLILFMVRVCIFWKGKGTKDEVTNNAALNCPKRPITWNVKKKKPDNLSNLTPVSCVSLFNTTSIFFSFLISFSSDTLRYPTRCSFKYKMSFSVNIGCRHVRLWLVLWLEENRHEWFFAAANQHRINGLKNQHPYDENICFQRLYVYLYSQPGYNFSGIFG